MKTTYFRSQDVESRWFIYDASQHVLGRMASDIAMRLMGKDRPTYTPHVDTGGFVVVINAEKVQATGAKEEQKIYHWYSGYHGGRKERTLAEMRRKSPEQILRLAVKRMLPKSRLGRRMLGKLKVYVGPDHPHAAQAPEPVTFREGSAR